MTTGTSDYRVIYISGPMSGIPQHNFPAFQECEDYLRHGGFSLESALGVKPSNGRLTVVNPASLDEGDTSREFAYYIRRDLLEILARGVNTLVMLPGWEASRGATLEYDVARALGLEIFAYDPSEKPGGRISRVPLEPRPPKLTGAKTVQESWVEEATRIVNGERIDSYGHPYDDFSRHCALMRAYFGDKKFSDLQPEDVSILMVLLKLSREANAHKRDNMVDVIGYVLTMEKVLARRNELARATPNGTDPS